MTMKKKPHLCLSEIDLEKLGKWVCQCLALEKVIIGLRCILKKKTMKRGGKKHCTKRSKGYIVTNERIFSSAQSKNGCGGVKRH